MGVASSAKCCSVLMDGADVDAEDETEDRRGAEGEDRLGRVAGTGDVGRSGLALQCPPNREFGRAIICGRYFVSWARMPARDFLS